MTKKCYAVYTYSNCVPKNVYHCCEEQLSLYIWTPKFKIGDYFRDDDNHIGQVININNDYYDVYFIGYTTGGICQEDRMSLWQPKRGETVLVTESYTNYWEEAIFSFQNNDGKYHMVGGSTWTFCIPFDINKLGKLK